MILGLKEEVKINNIESYLIFHRFSFKSLNDLIASEKRQKICLGFKDESTPSKGNCEKHIFPCSYVYY